MTKKKKYSNIWKLNNTILNNPCVKEEIVREIRKYFEQCESTSKFVGCSQGQYLEGNAHIRKVSNLGFHLKKSEKTKTKTK